jgi:hypothetical protein
VFYEVFEGYGSEGTGTNCKTRKGATHCTLGMHPLGSTDKPAYTATVPAGGWTYRVGIAASWTGAQTESHVTALSPVVHVIVH